MPFQYDGITSAVLLTLPCSAVWANSIYVSELLGIAAYVSCDSESTMYGLGTLRLQ